MHLHPFPRFSISPFNQTIFLLLGLRLGIVLHDALMYFCTISQWLNMATFLFFQLPSAGWSIYGVYGIISELSRSCCHMFGIFTYIYQHSPPKRMDMEIIDNACLLIRAWYAMPGDKKVPKLPLPLATNYRVGVEATVVSAGKWQGYN